MEEEALTAIIAEEVANNGCEPLESAVGVGGGEEGSEGDGGKPKKDCIVC